MLPWINRDKRPLKIAIVGDLILDEYITGNISRISPEAPVPILNAAKSFHTAGGAANTSKNIALSGGYAILVGICGTDNDGKALLSLLSHKNIDKSGILLKPDYQTIKKTRIIASNQQIVRVDWEKIQTPTLEKQNKIINYLKDQVFDAILISDYGKGLLSENILKSIYEIANNRKIPCVVDPKGKDFHKYRGSTLITPNLSETKEALNIDDREKKDAEALGKELQEKFGLNDVLITQGADGMTFVPKAKDKKAIFSPAKAKEVFDVSGAGDTVASLVTLSLGASSNIYMALNIANLGAAIVVEKRGTQPVTEAELLERIKDNEKNDQAFRSRSKLKTIDEISEISSIEEKTKQIVFTNGCFDILHAGHIDYLEKAKNLGDILIVGINTDESVREIKGRSRPINTFEDRIKTLSALSCIDYIVGFKEKTPQNIIEKIKPSTLVKGSDYKENEVAGAKFVKSYGGKIELMPLLPNRSTSKLIEKLKEVNI